METEKPILRYDSSHDPFDPAIRVVAIQHQSPPSYVFGVYTEGAVRENGHKYPAGLEILSIGEALARYTPTLVDRIE